MHFVCLRLTLQISKVSSFYTHFFTYYATIENMPKEIILPISLDRKRMGKIRETESIHKTAILATASIGQIRNMELSDIKLIVFLMSPTRNVLVMKLKSFKREFFQFSRPKCIK